MGNHNDDLRARIKRVRAQSRHVATMPESRVSADRDFDEQAMVGAILRPQLALLLGALALIAGRAIAMNTFMIEPNTEVLGLGEGCVVLVILFAIGILFGKADVISHVALVAGAALAFLGEGFYIPLAPDLMESVYNPGYVAMVLLGGF